MRSGKIIQQASPEDIYKKPGDEYVAGLLGACNIFDPSQQKIFSVIPGIQMADKKMLIRPESFSIVAGSSQAVKGEIKKVNFLGSAYELEVISSGVSIIMKVISGKFSPGKIIYVSVSASDVWYLKDYLSATE